MIVTYDPIARGRSIANFATIRLVCTSDSMVVWSSPELSVQSRNANTP